MCPTFCDFATFFVAEYHNISHNMSALTTLDHMVGRRLACDWMVDDGDWRFKVDPAHQSSNQHPSNLQMFLDVA